MKAVLIVAWETPWVMSDSRWFKSKTQTLLTFFESSSSEKLEEVSRNVHNVRRTDMRQSKDFYELPPVESAHHYFTFERKRWKVGGVRTHTALKCLNVRLGFNFKASGGRVSQNRFFFFSEKKTQ